ncbi:hypothetical protein L7F22_030679 [Adiantum nelumboides]|nr:hypothetical protein [Adiantum nelumboides]
MVLRIACPIFKGKKHDDPDVHIQAFEQHAELKHIMEEEWEEYFPHTLKEAAKKWQRRRNPGRSNTSTSDTTEIEQFSSTSSESSEDDRKQKKKGSWSKKIDDMSRRIFEISGLRGSTGKTEKWFTKCTAKNHTTEECTQCNYCKAFGHEWTNCRIRIHHLKEGKDLSMIAFASMEPIASIIEQAQSAPTLIPVDIMVEAEGEAEEVMATLTSKGILTVTSVASWALCSTVSDKPAITEVKQPEPVPVRAITRNSGVVIEELPVDEPASSKLNPKAKEWEQHRSTWKEKRNAKEFDEWKEQRERTPVPVAEAFLLETQTVGTGSIPVDSSDDNSDSEKEQDEIEIQMCQRIQQLTIELEDIRTSLPAVAKFIKQKKQQAEAMTVEVPQIKDDEVPVIQVDYKNRKQWELLLGVILDGGAGVIIIGKHMKEKMGITNFKPAPFRVRMPDQRMVQPSGLLENLHIKVGSEKFKTNFLILDVQGAYGMLLGRPWLRSAKVVQDYANQIWRTKQRPSLVNEAVVSYLGDLDKKSDEEGDDDDEDKADEDHEDPAGTSRHQGNDDDDNDDAD